MAINTALKITLTTVGLGGAVTGASIGAYNHFSKSNNKEQESKNTNVTKTYSITSLLKDNKLELISPTDDKVSVWTPKYNQFKNDHTSKVPTGIWTIEHWDRVKDQDEGLDTFKELCEINGKNNVENNKSEVYKQVEKYCTKPLTQIPSEQS
ncbi:hypothetical protein A6V39_01200 [Candidatus Mycoplasma haematobovis]|uniref:Uncharacterized protein n=1 Tax=Candidatus Mycoplasma haematobovis TaxID=432608 RepID=A0A1A9QG32_9MOLU|nr:hypothetical protein [Candidatus Mycoplasma haematobovis]OAL10670.1 hypothetical protein A6V39_01200 [Candidatus Mycoplasma haematobovis]